MDRDQESNANNAIGFKEMNLIDKILRVAEAA